MPRRAALPQNDQDLSHNCMVLAAAGGIARICSPSGTASETKQPSSHQKVFLNQLTARQSSILWEFGVFICLFVFNGEFSFCRKFQNLASVPV